jgi:hypothetical protein
MPAWERERGELPTPNLPSRDRKTARGLIVLGIRVIAISTFRNGSVNHLDKRKGNGWRGAPGLPMHGATTISGNYFWQSLQLHEPA